MNDEKEPLSVEEAVLGCILFEGPDAYAYCVSEGVRAQTFNEPRCAVVWGVVERLVKRGVRADHILAWGEMTDEEKRSVNRSDFGRLCDHRCPTSLSMGDFVRELNVRHAARMRESLWREGVSASGESNPEREMEASAAIVETFRRENPDETFQSAAKKLAEELESGNFTDHGLKTGLVDFDRALGTLQPNELATVGARPGGGKSSFLRQAAIATMRAGHKVCMASTEMSRGEIARAMAANISGVNWPRSGSIYEADRTVLIDALRSVTEKGRIRILESSSLAVVIARFRAAMLEEEPPRLFVVDYLQQLSAGTGKETRAERIGIVTRALKGFAMDFRVPVIAASQLSRESEDKEEPQLHDLRDSGAIEQDSDRVIFLTPAKDQIMASEARRIAIRAIQAKNRNGPMGECTLSFDRWTTRFANYAKG